jgi:hypothetical protein
MVAKGGTRDMPSGSYTSCSPLMITFNYLLHEESVAQSLTFDPSLDGETSLNQAKTMLTVRPPGDKWRSGTRYTVGRRPFRQFILL